MQQRSRHRAARPMAIAIATALAASFAALPAQAQQYPSKPIRFVIPFPPGGSNDIIGRVVGHQLAERLGQPVVIDNRAGAGGVIGTEIVANAVPDGHTILMVSVAFAFNPALYKLPFDPAKAFAPVAPIGTGPNVLVVNPKLPVNSVKELIAYARAKPGALNIATAGVGSFQHLSSELFVRMADIKAEFVPFKGGPPAIADVIAGNTQFAIGALIMMLPHMQAGRLRALGVGSLKRNSAIPDVPTIAEAGVPKYEVYNWWGVVAPAKVPAAVIDRLNREIGAIAGSAEFRKRLESEGAEPLVMSPAEFAKFIAAETARWSRVVREAGIKPE
jgi:tripartite-type tricarboxylate transporter receptor subunit TctC